MKRLTSDYSKFKLKKLKKEVNLKRDMITNESTYQQILPSSSSHGVLYGLPKVRNKGCPSSQPGDDVLLSRLRDTQRRFPPKCIANTIQAIQSIFRALEINSKRCNEFFFVRSS